MLSSLRNWLNRPLSPITSSQVIPNVFIWYFPFENCWPAITSACVTSYIPQDGLLGPPVGAKRTGDDEATIDDVVEGVVCDLALEEELDNRGTVEATLEVVVDNSDDETTDDDTDNGVISGLTPDTSLVEQPNRTISPITHDNAAT